MSKEVIYLHESDRKRAVKPEPFTIQEFVGVNGDPTSIDNIENYVNYRIQFEKEIKKIKLTSNRRIDEFEEIVYLGKCHNDHTFACRNSTCWEIIYGELNSGIY